MGLITVTHHKSKNLIFIMMMFDNVGDQYLVRFIYKVCMLITSTSGNSKEFFTTKFDSQWAYYWLEEACLGMLGSHPHHAPSLALHSNQDWLHFLLASHHSNNKPCWQSRKERLFTHILIEGEQIKNIHVFMDWKPILKSDR